MAICQNVGLGHHGPVQEQLQKTKIQGTGKLRYLGFLIYEAVLYRPEDTKQDDFALEITYRQSLSGANIAKRSAQEMRRIGVSEQESLALGQTLEKLLPNVEDGHTLTAIYKPQTGTSFFHNGQALGNIRGEDFAKAFFGIWFDPKTSAPKLRESLLGLSCLPLFEGKPC